MITIILSDTELRHQVRRLFSHHASLGSKRQRCYSVFLARDITVWRNIRF
ncbi:hypothetical protein Plhal304r1_c005g0019771 [Plasmopara halstedii]